MQKDYVVDSITSTLLGDGTKKPFVIEGITQTKVNGEKLHINGYLDIGLYDTMKDLFVNFIGATIFSIIGYFYVRNRGRGKIARMFIPKLKNSKNGEEKDENKKP